jgi:hypothetical protein
MGVQCHVLRAGKGRHVPRIEVAVRRMDAVRFAKDVLHVRAVPVAPAPEPPNGDVSQGPGLAGAALAQPLAAVVKAQAREEHVARDGVSVVLGHGDVRDHLRAAIALVFVAGFLAVGVHGGETGGPGSWFETSSRLPAAMGQRIETVLLRCRSDDGNGSQGKAGRAKAK